MLLRFLKLKTNPFRTEAAKILIAPINAILNELRVEDVTTSSGRLFHVGKTLFKKKLCLTVTDWEKSFLSETMTHSNDGAKLLVVLP